MGISKAFSRINATLLAIFMVLITVNGQIGSPCTSSMMSGFTPCVNYLTGSSANGAAPSASCCDAVESLMGISSECACLIISGNVPFSIPFSQTLSDYLPIACNIPLQCKASGVPLPPPGPKLFGPAPPPMIMALPPQPPHHAHGAHSPHAALSPFSPAGSKALASAPPTATKKTSETAPEPAQAFSPEQFSPEIAPGTAQAFSPDELSPETAPVIGGQLAPTATIPAGIRPVFTPTLSASHQLSIPGRPLSLVLLLSATFAVSRLY